MPPGKIENGLTEVAVEAYWLANIAPEEECSLVNSCQCRSERFDIRFFVRRTEGDPQSGGVSWDGGVSDGGNKET